MLGAARIARVEALRGLVDDELVSEMADRLDARWAWRSDPEAEWPESDKLDGEEC